MMMGKYTAKLQLIVSYMYLSSPVHKKAQTKQVCRKTLEQIESDIFPAGPEEQSLYQQNRFFLCCRLCNHLTAFVCTQTLKNTCFMATQWL